MIIECPFCEADLDFSAEPLKGYNQLIVECQCQAKLSLNRLRKLNVVKPPPPKELHYKE